MRYTQISSQLFIKNREKLFNQIEYNAVCVFISSDQMPRNGDLYYPYRQNSDFFYLTGIEQEKSRLLLYKTATTQAAILFIIEPNKKMEIWEGKKLQKEDAKEISGISDVRYLSEFDSFFKEIVEANELLYINKNENPRFEPTVVSSDILFESSVKSTFPQTSIQSIAPIMKLLRIIKEPEEVSLMKYACNITSKGFKRVLQTTKAGMKEYEVEAELTYEFMKNGANGHAYEPIIASGQNSCFLHYNKNDATLKGGDILFMDFGAEYANYSSDCSRAIPVNGKFSDRQKAVYTAVLNVFKSAKEMIVPGTTILQYHSKVCTLIEEECISLGLFTKEDVLKQSPDNPLYFDYYMHGTSHFMGLDTHDLGDKDIALQPGMVVSCEPGIYIMEESLGIRLENDILLTESGNEDLMSSIPIEIDDIEALMK